MAFIRPSLILQAMLVPGEYTEATAKEIKRSYLHIAQVIVKEQPAEEAAEGNVMQFRIRMMKPYWDVADPQACELWDAVMPQWLANQARNVSTAMHNYNTVLHAPGAENVTYGWADFEFNDHALLRIRLDEDNTIGANVAEAAGRVRALQAAGAFGEGEIARIRIPSRASIAEQKQAYAQLKAEIEAARAAADETQARASAAGTAAQTFADDAALAGAAEPAIGEDEAVARAAAASKISHDELVRSVSFEEGEVGGAESDGSEVVIDGAAAPVEDPLQADAPEAGAPQVPVLPPFELDYSVWGVEYADGRVVEFDTRTV